MHSVFLEYSSTASVRFFHLEGVIPLCGKIIYLF